jgi:O-antigen/teichoic acid export membrane protein
LFAQSSNCFVYYFESLVQTKYSSIAKIISTVIGATLKFLCISLGTSLTFIAAAYSAEAILTLAILFGFYMARRIPKNRAIWKFSWTTCKDLLKRSLPLLLSSLASIIYLKIDQVMLGVMASQSAVGIYAAAARLSEAWYFLPVGIAGSLFPALIAARRNGNEGRFEMRFAALCNFLFLLAAGIAIVVSLLANQIIHFLYGAEFHQSASILRIHVWGGVFVFLGAALSKWLIIENCLFFSLWRHLLGALINVIMNLLLIPKYGGTGAAVATLFSYAIANIFSCFAFPRTRKVGMQLLGTFYKGPVAFLSGTKVLLSGGVNK